VSATIGRDHVIDLVGGNGRPHTIHLNFVVVANHATLGWPTIHQIAARALAIISLEFRVEPLMPFIVPYSVVSFLRRRACTKKHGHRAAEKDNEAWKRSVAVVSAGNPSAMQQRISRRRRKPVGRPDRRRPANYSRLKKSI
jgi:hypothetical protein